MDSSIYSRSTKTHWGRELGIRGWGGDGGQGLVLSWNFRLLGLKPAEPEVMTSKDWFYFLVWCPSVNLSQSLIINQSFNS